MKASYLISDFLTKSVNDILTEISEDFFQKHGQQASVQNDAWKEEINHLKDVLRNLGDGRILFEYDIPSLSKTIDAVLLYHGKVFVLEYKTGTSSSYYTADDIQQVTRYAMRLKYFHSESNTIDIVPILIEMNGPDKQLEYRYDGEEQMFSCLLCNKDNLRTAIDAMATRNPFNDSNSWESRWGQGIFKASPTIISSARNVWKQNNVSGFQMPWSNNSSRLSPESTINKLVEYTKARQGKAIVFVTGVPGAGKTLVGLDVSVAQQHHGASMLSGNGPLVQVLTTALKRDLAKNRNNLNKDKSMVSVETIIRDAYGYKKEIFEKRLKYNVGEGTVALLENADRGSQHVIIFDEAQRAWTQEKLIRPGQTGKKYWQEEIFPFSEAGLLLWDMNQRDWGVFVCLVGGGQEIHTGEAGIGEWLKAIASFSDFKDWKVYMADNLKGDEYDRKSPDTKTLKEYRETLKEEKRLFVDNSLHLTECQRSLRSEKLAEFVNELLACNKEETKKLYDQVKRSYKIHLTRDMEKARQYLRKKEVQLEGISDDDIRVGMLMSSKAARIRPLGYENKKVSEYLSKVANWFLDSSDHVDSSNFLEVALDEFFVQGLELDVAAVIWDADFRYNPDNNEWDYYKFNGRYWGSINGNEHAHEIKRYYMKNAYRVLLTRARAGLVIVVPEGSVLDAAGKPVDATRNPDFYDCTYEYLLEILGEDSLL